MPEDRDQALRRTEAIGRALYEADALAAVGSDAFLAAAKGTPDPRVRGYVVDRQARRVIFLGETAEGVRRFAVIELPERGHPSVRVVDAEQPSQDELAMYAARAAVLARFKPPCPARYNPIVIRDPDRPQWVVYLLAATVDPNEIIIGGHVRATVSEEGAVIGELTPLNRSCMAQPRTPPGGGQTVALVMNHPNGSIPSEGHVFTSLLYGVRISVLTNDGTAWSVAGGRIERIAAP